MDTRQLLRIDGAALDSINAFLLGRDNPVIDDLVAIVERHGGAREINRAAAENGKLERLLDKVRQKNPGYADDLAWLAEQRDARKFISLDEFRRNIGAPISRRDASYQVTLEISALQYFPWLIAEARQAIAKGELMPSRFIRVRAMKEQEEDGDLAAVAAGMKIVGASWVESLDTRGTDGSNIHLGGPDTITGYFGGVGQPNDHPYTWLEEYLHYYMTYGVKQVLNLNGGTVLAGYLLHKLGVDMEFKISVFMGNDNPFNVLWTLLTARLFARDDGSTSLIGFNLSNSVSNWTIERASAIRSAFGFDDRVRLEHHITETFKSIVRQPYDKLDELVEVAQKVKNISAKHEGGVPSTDGKRAHPSDILDYFMARSDVEAKGLMSAMEQNYLDKHGSVQRTARALLMAGVPVLAAPSLHHC
ncbi:MAG TPA: hypothetical protein VL354_09045 [Spirochaetia bacterium]|nr:hypothetical protein [Spirochaetia bacterium]